MLNQELELSLNMAFARAREHRHEFMTVEHLLLALLSNPSAREALEQILPPAGSPDHYRITLTGESEPLDIPGLLGAFAHVPNLELVDATQPPVDAWKALGSDSLEGQFFGMLKQEMERSPEEADILQLAAELSRRILDGQEVVLP